MSALKEENALRGEYRFGEVLLRIDREKRTLTRNSVDVDLTPSEFNLLAFILVHDGEVVTPRMLMGLLYPEERARPEQKIIDVFFCKMKRKLPGVRIEIVWGLGRRCVSDAVKDKIARAELEPQNGTFSESEREACTEIGDPDKRWHSKKKRKLASGLQKNNLTLETACRYFGLTMNVCQEIAEEYK